MVNPLMEQYFHVPLSPSKFVGKKPWAIILDYTPRTKKPPQTGYTIGHLGPIYNKVGNLVWKILLETSWSFELFYKK